jgi:hypothetical protein
MSNTTASIMAQAFHARPAQLVATAGAPFVPAIAQSLSPDSDRSCVIAVALATAMRESRALRIAAIA